MKPGNYQLIKELMEKLNNNDETLKVLGTLIREVGDVGIRSNLTVKLPRIGHGKGVIDITELSHECELKIYKALEMDYNNENHSITQQLNPL